MVWLKAEQKSSTPWKCAFVLRAINSCLLPLTGQLRLFHIFVPCRAEASEKCLFLLTIVRKLKSLGLERVLEGDCRNT
eukprot:604895-Amphidinium_carterae.1